MTKRKIIAHLFDSYINAVYDEPIGDMQRTEIQRAFYAGSKATIDTLQSVTDVGDEVTDGDLAFMDDVYAELMQFSEDTVAQIEEQGKRGPQPAQEGDDPQLGDMPVEEQFVVQMQAIAQTLDEFLNPDLNAEQRKNGFILMVFPFGDQSGRANYISNARREDVAKLLAEQAKRFAEPSS